MDHSLQCRRCGAEYGPGIYTDECPACLDDGRYGRLEVEYDINAIDEDALPFGEDADGQNMWRYAPLLPLLRERPVTLGEGGTPLLEAKGLSAETNRRVFLKNETVNPTWSFKDRLNALLLSNLAAQGEQRVATSSTGNQGASMAAYASKAGIPRSIVLLPEESEDPIQQQVQAYGAECVVTEMARRGDLLAALAENGWYPAVSKQPYGLEGYKTIAYELYEQLGEAPDAIVFPVGTGDGLYGIYKGFRDLDALGFDIDLPRLYATQSEERDPMVQAVQQALDSVSDVSGPMPITVSVAGQGGSNFTLQAIGDSGGYAYACSRAEVEAAIRDLGSEGIFVEPSTALTAAALRKAVVDGQIGEDETVVCVQTGAGVKWPNSVGATIKKPPTIEPTLEALKSALDDVN